MNLDIVIEGTESDIEDETMQEETISVTDPTEDRYNTFGFISWWKQGVVRDATVMVIGAGALGNEVLKNLALMGVGKIFIVDFDTIEAANLSRSVLFRASENGKRKAEIAAQAVQELNPDVAVQWFHGNINHDLGLGVYRCMDVVIGCLDNREARLSINQACWHLNKPWVDGAIQELLGIARVFWPNRGACYECTLTDEDYRIISVRQSCQLLAHENVIRGKVPTTPTISSIVAATQTQEALKLLHGMDVESGKAIVFNGLNNDIFTMDYQEKEDCLSHEIYDEIVELKEARAEKTTIGALLQIAREALGEDAMLLIPAFAEKAICSKCNTASDIMRPRHTLTFADAHCPECGEFMDIITREKIKGEESYLDRPLSYVGIPALDIVPVRTEDWQFKFFELTGDLETFFEFRKMDSETLNQFYRRRENHAGQS
jgi:adenylyltransferase/sulfurtransferase